MATSRLGRRWAASCSASARQRRKRVAKGGESGKQATKVWRTFDHRPRFGNNYVGLRNRLTILSEAYSYLDFRRRVAVTEAFVEEIVKYSAAHAEEIVALIRRVDANAVRRALAAKPPEFGVSFELKPLARPVPILIGQVEKRKNPRSGREMVAMIEDRFTSVRMPDYGLFSATRSVALPRAYLLRAEAGLRPVIDRLVAHGLAVEETTEPIEVEVESFLIGRVTRAGRSFQGHHEVKLSGRWRKETVAFPAGSIIVRTAQPLAPLAFYLLEAESDDSLATWNLLDAYLEQGRVYPIYKLLREARVAGRLMG